MSPRQTACARCRQQVNIAAGADGEVLVGLGRLGAARVDDDDARRAHAGPWPWRGSRAPSTCCRWTPWGWRRGRQQLAALDIRHGHAHPVPEHQAAGELFGHLVERGSREDIAGAQRLDEAGAVEHQAGLVDNRVAQRDGDSVGAVGLPQRQQPGFDLGKGFVPARGYEAAVAADQRGAAGRGLRAGPSAPRPWGRGSRG